MIDQDTSERCLTGDDLVTDSLGDVMKIEPDDSKLHHLCGVERQQNNFPAVQAVTIDLVDNFHLHSTAVVFFHRHRHVVIVNEHLVVRRRCQRRRHMLSRLHQSVATIKQPGQGMEFVMRIHGLLGRIRL